MFAINRPYPPRSEFFFIYASWVKAFGGIYPTLRITDGDNSEAGIMQQFGRVIACITEPLYCNGGFFRLQALFLCQCEGADIGATT